MLEPAPEAPSVYQNNKMNNMNYDSTDSNNAGFA